jgi:hypothetical protein
VRAETTRALGAANAEAETAKLKAYAGVDPAVLTALALQEVAQNIPAIGTLNLTPDVLTQALTQLSTPRPRSAPKPPPAAK